VAIATGDGGNKARLSGETTKETVKTIARGMPDVSGVTVVSCLRAFYFCTQGCGRIERPAFPAPSDFRRRDVNGKTRAKPASEIADSRSSVIARSESDEAIQFLYLVAGARDDGNRLFDM
jgi:hypothetical protein